MNQLIIINLCLYFVTFILLYRDKDIKVEILKSNVFDFKDDKFTNIFLLSLIYPYTLFKYFQIKQNKMSNLKAALVIAAIISITFFAWNQTNKIIQFSNTEIDIRNKFEQLEQQRSSLFDKIYSEIPMLANIAIHNDSMFIKVVEIQMSGRKDGDNLTWKWLQEQNPTASYHEVSRFYENLTTVVSQNKQAFYNNEIELQNQVLSHKDLLTKFPGSLYNKIFDRTIIEYKPILVLRDSSNINKVF